MFNLIYFDPLKVPIIDIISYQKPLSMLKIEVFFLLYIIISCTYIMTSYMYYRHTNKNMKL